MRESFSLPLEALLCRQVYTTLILRQITVCAISHQKKKGKKRMFASCVIVIHPPVWVRILSFSFLFWFSPSFVGWQVHAISIFLRYSSKMCLKECRKRSIHPPQPFFAYIHTYTYCIWRKLYSIVVIPIYSPLLYFQKKSERVCFLSAFHSFSVPSFELFFICHEDQRTEMSEK